MEQKFLENQFPSSKEREAISKELDLTQDHIQVTTTKGEGEVYYLKVVYAIDIVRIGEEVR